MSWSLPPSLSAVAATHPIDLLLCSECGNFLNVVTAVPSVLLRSQKADCSIQKLSCSHHPHTAKYHCALHGCLIKNTKSLHNHTKVQQNKQNQAIQNHLNNNNNEEEEEQAVDNNNNGNNDHNDISSDIDFVDMFEDFDFDSTSPIHDPQYVNDFLDNSFAKELISSNSRDYFKNEFNIDQPCSGSRSLVKEAFQSTLDQLPSMEETMFHLMVAKFLLGLTESQRTTFYTICRLTYHHGSSIGKGEESLLFSTGVTWLAVDESDYKSTYLTAKSSIARLVPRPMSHSIAESPTYSYCNYQDTMQHYLAMGNNTPFDFYQHAAGVHHLPSRYNEVMQAAKNLGQPTYIIMIDEWRDKFEASTTKKNRSSVLANTMTVVSSSKNYSTDPTNTYVQCIGIGSESPRSAELKMNAELESLCSKLTWFFSAALNAVVPCLVVLRCSIQDRVERVSHTNFLSHSSGLSRRWGYIATFDLMGLVSCEQCEQRRIRRECKFPNAEDEEEEEEDSHCTECADFDYQQVPQAFHHPLPQDYPRNKCTCNECPAFPDGREIPPSTDYLLPKKLSFPWTAEAALVAIHYRRNNKMNVAQCRCYLKLCGMNAQLATNLLDKLSSSSSNNDEDDEEDSDLAVLEK